MLTIKQINEISFRKSGFSGYKPEDVDDFIDEVSESVTALVKENHMLKAKASELSAKNGEMREKLRILAEKIEAYRDDEDGIKNALLSAQKLGTASIKEAKAKADAIIVDANVKADEMVVEAKRKTTAVVENYQSKIDSKQREFDTIKAAVTAFRSSLYDIYRNHLNAIESIPDFSGELPRKEPVAVAPVNEEENLMGDIAAETSTPVVEPQAILEFEEIDADSFDDEDYQDIVSGVNAELDPESVTKDSFEDIDFNAYSDIPEVLKQDKATLYSTLEFGDDIDIKKK